MTKPRAVKYFLYSIVGLNLVVLFGIFIIPRTQIILANLGSSQDELLETRGPGDLPNLRTDHFILANRIKKFASENATLFMFPLPPANQGPLLKTLFPRKIFWGETPIFSSQIRNPPPDSFVVIRNDWGEDLCKKSPSASLEPANYKICILKN